MPVSAYFSRFAAAAAAVAIVAMALLHLVRPELLPSSHMLSEYAIGPYGWLMTLAFLAFALADWALVAAAAAHARSIVGRVGLVFLALAGLGAALGGIFAIDPSTNDPEKMSFSGHMHGVGFMIGVPSQLLAALLLALAARRVEAWPARTLALLAGLVWSSLLVMAKLLFAGHDFGLPNRLFMVFWAAFLISAARPLVHATPSPRYKPASQ